MCGIIGITSHRPVATELYDGLMHLQTRGQDAAGILTYNGQFHLKKGSGLVRDIFDQNNITRLKGTMGLGHTRYSTNGSAFDPENAQPFFISSPYGIAMVHNGNLTNYHELKQELAQKDRYHCNSQSDLEVIMNVFAAKLHSLPEKGDFFASICKAVSAVYDRTSGGYSVIGVIADKGMIAFRDPHGIRPLVIGKRTTQEIIPQDEYIFSSENTMYYPLGFELIGDVAPGEVVFVDMHGNMQRKRIKKDLFTPDIFEYVYLARPDAIINNVSVYRARLRMGQNLAKQWKKKYPDVLPDVVIPVPFTSTTAALSMARELGVRYTEGIYKNQFIGRTFIMPGQALRRRSVMHKLSPQRFEIEDKDVLLVDDSIVRGTTSREIVQMVRHAGARKVYFASTCPPVKFPDFYGIDIPTREELIAAHKTVDEIKTFIDSDILLYQEIDDLVEAVTRKGEHHIDRPSMPYLDGWYVTGDVDLEKMDQLELEREQGRVCG
ncbi:amidophosphoribosyltransferase [Candidatus Uhrbacteria bacterium]|nr:amidophosphoribosyltransferase [Candidatus Uhrbacteria bacterium]